MLNCVGLFRCEVLIPLPSVWRNISRFQKIVDVVVRDKLPFNGVESKNHFGVTEKNAIISMCCVSEIRLYFPMQSVSFTWIVWLAFLIFSFLARTANKLQNFCRPFI